MPSIIKVKLKWTGFSGAPGYTNFFYRDEASGAPTLTTATDATTKVSNFGAYIRSYLPIEVKLDVQTDVEVIEETTGQMVDVFNVAPIAQLPGEVASGPYSAASGACINWRTAGVRNGRRVRGRTFVVPLAQTAYQNDGTLSAGAMASFNGNLPNFLSNTGTALLGVYCRPTAPGASDGAWFETTGFNVNDKVAVLRSRRD